MSLLLLVVEVIVGGGASVDLKRLLSTFVCLQARKREGDLDEGKSTLVSELTIKVRLVALWLLGSY